MPRKPRKSRKKVESTRFRKKKRRKPVESARFRKTQAGPAPFRSIFNGIKAPK